MQNITLEQLCTASETGGVLDVALKGRGGAYLVQITTEAAYNAWLAAEIQETIDDPRPSIPHDEVMVEMEADIAALMTDDLARETHRAPNTIARDADHHPIT